MRKIEPPLPQSMEESSLENCEIAKAKGIKAFTDTKHDLIEMLSTIDDIDVPRDALMLSIAEDKELNLDDEQTPYEKEHNLEPHNFLKEYVYHEIKLSNSVPRKKGGIKSTQLVELLKTAVEEEKSKWNKFKDMIH